MFQGRSEIRAQTLDANIVYLRFRMGFDPLFNLSVSGSARVFYCALKGDEITDFSTRQLMFKVHK